MGSLERSAVCSPLFQLTLQVWSCSNSTGLLQIWDSRTFSQASVGGQWSIDCGGINILIRTKTAIWAGAGNSVVFVWDLVSHGLLKELRCHTDSVRSLCALGDEYVISGSGSNDGSVVVWKIVSA